jgi:hypothetical protein
MQSVVGYERYPGKICSDPRSRKSTILLHSNLLACWACWREEKEEECLVSKSINSSKSTTQTLYSSPESKLVGWIWSQNSECSWLPAEWVLLELIFNTSKSISSGILVQEDPRDPTHDLRNTLLTPPESNHYDLPCYTNFSQNHLHFSKFPKIKHGFFICQGEFWELWEKATLGTNLWWAHGFPFVFHK